MNILPSYLHSNNIENFESHNYDRIISLLKKDIHDLLINRKDENEYFDLELFFKKHEYYDKKKSEKMVICIKNDLNELGWNVKLSFADTGLFIYKDKLPSSCW